MQEELMPLVFFIYIRKIFECHFEIFPDNLSEKSFRDLLATRTGTEVNLPSSDFIRT
jgi:hypothetical protein